MITRLAPMAAALVVTLAGATPAAAAPPPNDDAAAAGEFRTITAENGTPNEREATGELVEARPDAGVPRCLGPTSFERTVWFRIPPAEAAREISVEASGRTLDVVDLAAFVQPAGRGPEAPLTEEANACAGMGSGGADASEEPTAGVTLRVPGGQGVLVQVGRRGTRGSPEDERVLLSLGQSNLPATARPTGDVADRATPTVAARTSANVPLGGSTITEEDPAQPPCPSFGSVWRRFMPAKAGPQSVVVDGEGVGALTVFEGERPTGENVLDCVNRERSKGDFGLTVRAAGGMPLWIRLGTDRPSADAIATLRIAAGALPPGVDAPPSAINGGKPKPGQGRCRPANRRTLGRSVLALRRSAGRVDAVNRSRGLRVRLRLRGGPLCGGRIALVGPRGRTYASTRGSLRALRPRVRLRVVRRLVPATYRLRVTAISQPGKRRVRIRSTGRLRLR